MEMEITCPKCREELESWKKQSQDIPGYFFLDRRNIRIEMREKRVAARRKRQAEEVVNDEGFEKDGFFG